MEDMFCELERLIAEAGQTGPMFSYREKLMAECILNIHKRFSDLKRVYGERLDMHRNEIDRIKFPLD
jgi:hypothetical protein